ncbi:D-alanyl-D-alanine carboxypeptidase [Lewinella sp. IMCC34191]|uniref:D-alanyl-D-alanine carboxypeptidase n=1 Tax=Lewinella sp. IMCC34191 TaxID=2259172 RepID=UPI000E21E395|nr:D-alanyl-D-alanine carboxypeptidase [Lewinella sp. IMCC34191]
MRRFLLLFGCLIVCGVLPAQEISQRAAAQELDNRIRLSTVFANGHSGFALYDLEAERTVYGYQEDRYFVPASNTKLLTFFVANRLLADGAPALLYHQSPDRLDVWGTGYPLLLHPSFTDYDTLLPWLKRKEGPIVLNFPEQDQPPRYGAGWSWDDFDYGYVYERSSLPVYGNRLYIDYQQVGDTDAEVLVGSPSEVVDNLVQDARQERTISRIEGSNFFTVNENFTRRYNFPLQRALTVDTASTLRYLRGGIPGKSVRSDDRSLPPSLLLDTLMSELPDTLYRKVLQESDNFLAEQLILLAATSRYGWPDEDALFEWATDTLFLEMDLGEVSYRDGSGLSRYNLVRPDQLVQIVAALDREVGHERLLSLLPAGGVSGTLEKRFDNRQETFVWAKTGTLSGVICISGLLRTRAGKWLAFSFLHNNVMAPSREYYAEMEDILGWVYDHL